MPIQFPRRRPRSNAVAGAIVSGSNAALKLFELKQRERISGEKTAVSETRAQTERVQGAARVATGRKQATTAAGRLAETKLHNVETERLARQKFEVENADRLPFTTQRTERVNQTFAAIGVDTPKALTNILNTHIKAGANAGAVYDDLSQGNRWDVITEAGADDLQKQYDKMIDPKTGTLIPGSDQANQILGIIDELRQDGSSKRILNMLFSNTREARAARTAEKAGFSAPFTDEFGNKIQRNLETGRLVKAPGPSKGIRLKTDAEGNVTFETGVTTGETTKTVQTDIQKKLIIQSEGLARIDRIIQEFRPEFQQIPTRLGIEWSALKEKLNIGNVSEEDKQTLQEFSVYKQDALENINLYIKEITGAQMSEKEAKRLKKAQPDPGEGIFGGDSPTEFQSKLLNTHKKLKASMARYNFYLQQGMTEESLNALIGRRGVVSLEDMPKLIDAEGDRIEQEVKAQNPGITIGDVTAQVKAELANIFGR